MHKPKRFYGEQLQCSFAKKWKALYFEVNYNSNIFKREYG